MNPFFCTDKVSVENATANTTSPDITTKTKPSEAPEPPKPTYKPACGTRNMEGIKFQVQNPVRLIPIKRYWKNVINVTHFYRDF